MVTLQGLPIEAHVLERVQYACYPYTIVALVRPVELCLTTLVV